MDIIADSDSVLNLNYQQERLQHRPLYTLDIRVSALRISDIITSDIVINIKSDIRIYL